MEERNVIDLKKARRAAKWNDTKAKLKKTKDAVVDYLIEHPEVALALGVTVISGTVAIVKGGLRSAKTAGRLKLEQNIKELYVYDRSRGFYWKLRKPLTNSQRAVINERLKSGERLGDILVKMGVLE